MGRRSLVFILLIAFLPNQYLISQTISFPGAMGFGRYAQGARAAASPQVYKVTNLNDAGPGSFRDAVSAPGRIIVFAVGGIVRLNSDIVVAANTTIAGQTAPGDGISFFGKRITFSGSNNTICRYFRVRLGATGNSGKDASGISNGTNIIFDHCSFTWGMDEVFSINWDNKGNSPDNITLQNCIIGQGLHRENHSAGGLIQTPDGGKVSLLRNLYISNKTRNPKVKGVNEFVNNVVYNYGNGNRLGDNLNYGWSGEAYIMGGSSGVSEVNVINNYFAGGPLTPPSETTPFSRGTGTFNIYGAGNYFDNNKNGVLDGSLVPFDGSGYPGITNDAFKATPFAYPQANPALTAEQAYQYVIDNVGPNYPRRDELDQLLVNEVNSKGTLGHYAYRETDLPLANGGLGNVFGAPAPADADNDGMPDAWEDTNGLDKNNPADAVLYHATQTEYLNIEVYINGLVDGLAPAFLRPPSQLSLSATSTEAPPSSTINLSWVDNSDNENAFMVERSINGTDYSPLATLPANSNGHQDNGQPNTTYYYRVRAVNATDTSEWSLPALVLTPSIPSAPTATSAPVPANNYQYAALNAGNVLLKWNGSANTTTYSLYFGTDASGLSKIADIPYSATASYTHGGLTDNQTYYWRVDAANGLGLTTGTVWSFRTSPTFAPGLIGFWSFDTLESRTIPDSSSFLNHGVLGLEEDDLSIFVDGKVKKGLDFASASTNKYVVAIPHQDHLFLDKGSFSISFWMKAPASLMPAGSTSAYLLCKGSITKNNTTGATGKRFNIEFKNSQLRFAIDDDDNGKDELQTSATPFFTNDWVHVVAQRDTATKKLKVYANGAFIKEQTVANVKAGIGEASDLVIGNIGELEFLANTNAPAAYRGMLDELKLFNYALNEEQVLALYHTSPLPIAPFEPYPLQQAVAPKHDSVTLKWKGGINTEKYRLLTGTHSALLVETAILPAAYLGYYKLEGLTENTPYYWQVQAIRGTDTVNGPVWQFTTAAAPKMVAHYMLNETSGAIAADSSGLGLDGTLSGMADAAWQPEGRLGGSLTFGNPAATGAVVVPHAAPIMFDQNSFTISLWVKMASNTYTSSNNKDCYLIHKGSFEPTTGKWYGLQLRNGTLTFAIDDGITKTDASVPVATGTYNLFTNTWKHIVIMRDVENKQLRIYIDNVIAATKSYTTLGIGSLYNLTIGNSAENKPYRDGMDDVRMYNYALSASELTTLFSGSPLPVNLTSFTAATVNEDVELRWATAGEQGSSHFILQNSRDGLHFENLATVKAKGFSGLPAFYSWQHIKPTAGIQYYRLLQYDINGAFKVSLVRQVRVNGLAPHLTVYPNPAQGSIQFEIVSSVGGQLQVCLVNSRGEKVATRTFNSIRGRQILHLDGTSNLPAGWYYLSADNGAEVFSSKVLVTK